MNRLPRRPEASVPAANELQLGTHWQPKQTREAPTLTLGDVLTVLRRHWLLIGACVSAAVGLAVAYTLVARPVYEATSVLRFESDQVNLPQLVQVISTENRIGTEMEVLQGQQAARTAVDSLGLRAELRAPRHGQLSALFSLVRVDSGADTLTLRLRPSDQGGLVASASTDLHDLPVAVGDTLTLRGVTFALRPAARSQREIVLVVRPTPVAVRRLQARLKVSRPARDADLIAVQVRGNDSVRVAVTANFLSDQVIARRRSLQIGRSEGNIRFLHQQLDTLGAQLHVAEDSLRIYRQRTGAVDPDEAARTEVGRLAQVQADRGALEAERDALARLLQQVRGDSGQPRADDPALAHTLMSFPTLLRNQAAAALFGALASLENERATLLVRRTMQDPDVQVLTTRIHELSAQLEGIAETYLQGLSNQADALNKVAHGFGAALDSLPLKQIEAARRERAVKVDQDLYTLIQTRLKEAEITQSMEDPTVHVAESAIVPDKPVRPRPLINLALGLMLGSVVGIVISLATEVSDRSVRSRADALLITGLPVLGAIPRVERKLTRALGRRGHRRGTQSAMVVGLPDKPGNGKHNHGSGRAAARLRSLLITRPEMPRGYVESLNQLYANMMLSYRETPLNVLAVTSPLPAEGKTLTSINLALTLAQRGVRVLLVDGDLRRGLINTVFAVPRRPGLAELLQGEARLEECTRVLPIGDSLSLTVLPSGTLLETPGPLLKFDRVRQLLESLKPHYDLVIVDTPPVNLLADAALFGAEADAVLIVVRAGHTQLETLDYAMGQLTAANAPIFGTVLNDIDLRHHGGDDYSYRYLNEVERYYHAGHHAK